MSKKCVMIFLVVCALNLLFKWRVLCDLRDSEARIILDSFRSQVGNLAMGFPTFLYEETYHDL